MCTATDGRVRQLAAVEFDAVDSVDGVRAAHAQLFDSVLRLDHSARTFLAYLLERPEVPRLLLRDITIDSDRSQWLLETLSLPLHCHFIDLAQAAAKERGDAPAHLEFRVANFIYSAASTVARRERLGKLVGGMDDDAQFAAALEVVLVEGALIP